jgi:dihydroneopterin aldolase
MGRHRMWDGAANYQRLALKGIRVTIRLGVLPAERRAPQPVEVDVELYRRDEGYRGGGLETCLDYDRVYRYLADEWPKRPHTDLLEAWAEDLIGFCLQDPRVEICRVLIRKPEAYRGQAIPEVEVVRRR